MQTGGHHHHRSLRPSTSANARASSSSNIGGGKPSAFHFVKKPTDIGKEILQPRAPPSSSARARPTYYARTTSSGRSNKFTSQFIGRGFYRDTSMAGYRRQVAIERMNEERRRKREQLQMLKKNKLQGDAAKEEKITVKRKWMEQQRLESDKNRNIENYSVVKIQSYMRGHLSRRHVAKLRMEVYDKQVANATTDRQSADSGQEDGGQQLSAGIAGANVGAKLVLSKSNQSSSTKNDFHAMASKHKQEKHVPRNDGRRKEERGSQKVRPQSAGIRNRRLKQNRIRADKNRARPGTSTGTYRSNARIRQFDLKVVQRPKVWVPSSASPRSYRPRPETTENRVVSPETLRRTGGGFTHYTLEESKIINDAIKDMKNMKNIKNKRKRGKQRRRLRKASGRSTSNNAIEVKQYAEKRRLAAERAILIRVERELKESKKFTGDPIGLHKKAKLVTLRILKRQKKKG